MTPNSFKIFELIKQPIVVTFVDLKSSNKKIARESIRVVDKVLPEVAPAFFYGVIIVYADNTLFNKNRKMLGITHNR